MLDGVFSQRVGNVGRCVQRVGYVSVFSQRVGNVGRCVQSEGG